MRVIAGKYRGRKLLSPKGREVRPTSERVKEALFSMLADRIRDARVIDLFAGTGSLGIEALSRGAAECLFVDSSAESCFCIRNNLNKVAAGSEARLVRSDFKTAMAANAGFEADIVFVDPPYHAKLYEESMQLLLAYDMIVSGGIIAVETSLEGSREGSGGKGAEPEYMGFALIKTKRYGKTLMRLYERTDKTE